MVSGSKLKCPSKVSWRSLTFSLLQCNLQQLFGKCTGRDEKCGKMWKNVLVTRFAILLLANNNECFDFDKIKDISYVTYFDAKKLYGWAISQ